MTLKLYYAPGACSFVPHTLLESAGADYEPVLVKIHKGENYGAEYKALNPRAQVPVLVDGGQVVTQIVAIVGYIDARFPEQGFLPREPLAQARVMETLAWMNNTVHPTFTHIFMPHKYSDSAAVQGELRSYNTQLYRGLLAELQGLLDAAQRAGRPYLGGAQFGPLDAYSLTLLRWGSLAGIDPQDYGPLWAFVQRLAQLPPVARVIERERLQLNLYKAA
ncbi:glutathione S-transferase family protein [Variovorax terrae]|uniref:Glutathione S-transferase family protein n=1 Tax=Variovorax terrae TaxID=2923278 RepID=A0A9X2ASW9_9BURK|nr:glutathione S-transferase family protein [Variovorax terrae]MCJ0765786.1 glutathione S-transferase family protein [Variovorax terrae]